MGIDSPAGAEEGVVFDYETMRSIIGVIALGIPFVCWIVFNTYYDKYIVPTSISVTYHLGARDLFVGMLFIVGSFLVAYNGYKHEREWLNVRWEFYLAKLAGVCAYLVALFPTNIFLNWLAGNELPFVLTDCLEGYTVDLVQLPANANHYCTISNFGQFAQTPYIHKAAAAVLLFIIFVFCWRFYTRVKHKIYYCKNNNVKDVNIAKLQVRKAVYCFCAIGMIVSFVAGVGMYFSQTLKGYWVFQVELVCLVLFGICWLTSSKKIPWLANSAQVERELSANLKTIRHRGAPQQ